jgi:hypothetical protein
LQQQCGEALRRRIVQFAREGSPLPVADLDHLCRQRTHSRTVRDEAIE